ncbi:activator-dependent family glycosyltransferase [Nonomuraea muscovyensis]|uniref:Glycosyltransferase (Activator-dependent family) n=1 Tax=Nonomuraea muscovyensis TaxID=1124761 RepID=A0A7X0CAI5_9ACTN|nr:activator-dependent family glycosyltransferase [Nonomuraea muscovyensis]MBB6351429.1 glycosyltransferase (activator-dependent family) [Nonomuraea muscovyensis]
MRVLLTQHAASAHLYLMVPIAWALKSAGHDVVIAGQPDIVDGIRRTGLTGVSVGVLSDVAARLAALPPDQHIYGSGHDLTEERAEVLTYPYVRDCLAAWASPLAFDLITDQSMYDDLVEFCRAWRPDLVIWDSITFPGPVAARACGAAHVRTTFGRDHWARMRDLFLTLRGDRDEDPVADWLTAKLGRYGCGYDEDLVLGQATVDTMPRWARFPLAMDHTYLPARYIPHNGPAVVPDWLIPVADRRRVCFTLGVSGAEMWAGQGSIALTDLFDAVADLDVEVIATVSPDRLPPGVKAPDNVRLVDFVPLNSLLPSCAAIVHHGGTGTTCTALAHGVPQLIVPAQLYDERGIALALAGQGAAVVVEPGDLTGDTLRKGLISLLDGPSYAAAATRLQRDAADTPSPADLVSDLENLVAARRER